MGLMPLAHRYLTGEMKVEQEIKAEDQGMPSWAKRYLQSFQINGEKSEPYVSDRDTWYYDDYPVKIGQTVVIPVVGAISQYDYCGTAGSKTIAGWYQKAQNDDDVKNIIELKNSPGGSVFGTRYLAEFKSKITKPILGYIDGLECSAAKYIGGVDDFSMASSDECIIGSIGTMTSFQDWSGWYKERGIIVEDLYSKTSPKKNDAYRKALKGDFTGYTDGILFKLDQSFMGFMKQCRPELSKDALDGADFLTQEAIQNGLCDGTGSFDQAYEMVQTLQKKDLSIKNTIQMSKVTMTIPKGAVWAVKALGGEVVGETTEDTKAEAEETDTTEGLNKAPEATAEAPASEATEENPLQAKVAALEAEKKALQEEATSYKNAISAISNNPAAQRTEARQTGNDVQPKTDNADDDMEALANTPSAEFEVQLVTKS